MITTWNILDLSAVWPAKEDAGSVSSAFLVTKLGGKVDWRKGEKLIPWLSGAATPGYKSWLCQPLCGHARSVFQAVGAAREF